MKMSWASQEDFYTFQRTAEPALTTSQPEIGAFMTKFDELAEAGYTDVIVIVLSSGISGAFSSLESLAGTVENIKVHVWDSQIAASGAGNQAKLAADMVAADKDVQTILARLEELRATTKVLFAVDEIRHLQRTGRISGGQATLGSLLNIKPLLTFEDTKIIAIGKERAMKRAWKKIEADFKAVHDSVDYKIRATIGRCRNNPDLADQWAADLTNYSRMLLLNAASSDLTLKHTGEKAMGLIWARDYKTLEN